MATNTKQQLDVRSTSSRLWEKKSTAKRGRNYFFNLLRTHKTGTFIARNRNKLLGLAIFLPLIFAANLARIFFMFFYVRTFDIAHYQIVHSLVWSWGMIFAVLLFWFVWMRKM